MIRYIHTLLYRLFPSSRDPEVHFTMQSALWPPRCSLQCRLCTLESGHNLPSTKWFRIKYSLIFYFCQFTNALSLVTVRTVTEATPTPTEPKVLEIRKNVTWLPPTYQQQSRIRRIMNSIARPMQSHAHHWRPTVVPGSSVVLTSK